jgi:hypothetical protein
VGEILQFEPQAALDTLPDAVARLACALGESGLGGAVLERLMADAVRFECTCCHIRISGLELMEAALASDPEACPPSKIQRLRLGYCARKGCESRYYKASFTERPGVDWHKVWSRAQESIAELENGANAKTSAEDFIKTWGIGSPRGKRLAAASGILLVVFVIGFSWSGCRVPGLSPAPRVFIVEPSSGDKR